jgi:phytoene synthase
MDTHLQHCMDLLKTGDRERYLTVLYAPAEHRPALAALYAFSHETARIRSLVSEPMPGEIRLQWWREAISGERHGEARQHPVAAALISAIDEYGLPHAAFDNCLQARVFDLYHDPMPDRETLEGYLGETVSVLFQLGVWVLNRGEAPGAADAAGHAGVALGVAGLLRDAPIHRHYRQIYIPREMFDAAGTDSEAWLRGEDREACARVVAILVAFCREHLGKAEAAVSNLPKSLKTAFLPLAGVKAVLAAAERAGAGVSETPVSLSPIRTQWLFLKRALRS